MKLRAFAFLVGIAWALLMSGCAKDATTEYYSDKHRPQFHFSPETQWMNDPNGLVYYDGEYHLFYQYYPDSTVWGPMHWGHAVSTDMIHWEHLPVALYPDELGYIFSGSAVIDWNNTSGLGTEVDSHPPMVAIFTHHHPDGPDEGRKDFQVQSIAYSVDRGRTWKKYEGNPVIGNTGILDFRDPKVIWDDERSQWVLVLAAGDKIKFYTSENLIDWKFSSDFGLGHGSQGRPWECPDLFPLQLANGQGSKWVLIVSQGNDALNGGSGTQYFIGEWDGENFTNENTPDEVLWLDHGKDNYAGVTWSDIPDDDGRRLFIGWMSNWQYAQVVPTEIWRSAMTIPRSLSLWRVEDQIRVRAKPVEELNSLRKNTITLDSKLINEKSNLLEDVKLPDGLYEIELVFGMESGDKIELILKNQLDEKVTFGYEKDTDRYFVNRSDGGDTSFSEEFAGIHYSQPDGIMVDTVDFRVYIDHSSIEIFSEQGLVAMTENFFPSENLNQLYISSPKENIDLLEGRIHALGGIWNNSQK